MSQTTSTRTIRERAIPIRPVALPELQPFMRWPGGKRFLVSYLLDHVPTTFGRYFEPFLGGAALFFALRPDTALLSDKNEPLIACYQAVRESPHLVQQHLRRLPNSKADYYRVRRMRPRTPNTRAARMIYLSALAFNGIYRENRAGEFNVPYGGRTRRVVTHGMDLRKSSMALAKSELKCCDFDAALAHAKSGDLVYLDPPYTVAHENNGFIKYNSQIFSWDDQRRLAATAHRLAEKGCHVLISNAHHPSIRDLYHGFRLYRVDRESRVAADPDKRQIVSEYILASCRT